MDMKRKNAVGISGKDSLYTAIVASDLYPYADFEYFFNDTGVELPETYAWLSKVEQYLGQPLTRVSDGESLTETIRRFNILPSIHMRYCTRMKKIEPMERYFKDGEYNLFIGLRYDERDRMGYVAKSDNIHVYYPLIEQRMTLVHVYTGLKEVDLLPPTFFWKRLYDEVEEILGDKRHYLDSMHELTKGVLFSWRTRPNCYFCFNQRLYEWVGLYEHYPELFATALELENTVGAEGFTWRSNKESLESVIARGDAIVSRRAKKVASQIIDMNENNKFDMSDDEFDVLAVTTCGVFCGK